MDSGDCASADAAGCAWAWTDAQTNGKNIKANAAALNAVTCIVRLPKVRCQTPHN